MSLPPHSILVQPQCHRELGEDPASLSMVHTGGSSGLELTRGPEFGGP